MGVKRQIEWRNVFSVSCKVLPKKNGKEVRKAGGVFLLWKEDVKVSLKSYNDDHIDVIIQEGANSQPFRFSGVYGQPKAENRHMTWALLNKVRWMMVLE